MSDMGASAMGAGIAISPEYACKRKISSSAHMPPLSVPPHALLSLTKLAGMPPPHAARSMAASSAQIRVEITFFIFVSAFPFFMITGAHG
jgi:hypothetical protein